MSGANRTARCPRCAAPMDRRTVQTFAGAIGRPPEFVSGYQCERCDRSYEADAIDCAINATVERMEAA